MPTEVAEHVGRALKARREAVGVTLAEIGQGAGVGMIADVKWIETATQPSARRVIWHYGWVSRIATDKRTWGDLLYAQRQQWYDTDLDIALTASAQQRVGSRAWWWGRGHTQGRAGAQCYVCDRWIYTYDSGRPMHNPARLALMQHRSLHALAGVPTPRLYPLMEAS